MKRERRVYLCFSFSFFFLLRFVVFPNQIVHQYQFYATEIIMAIIRRFKGLGASVSVVVVVVVVEVRRLTFGCELRSPHRTIGSLVSI